MARRAVESVGHYGRSEGLRDLLAVAFEADREAERRRFCLYCTIVLGPLGNKEPDARSVEHLVPTSRGGLDIPENVFWACAACNSKKAGRLPSEWRDDLPARVYELERVAVALHGAIKPRRARKRLGGT
ncbi:MAG: HNH endonuclease [Gemmatimonadales bacterium]